MLLKDGQEKEKSPGPDDGPPVQGKEVPRVTFLSLIAGLPLPFKLALLPVFGLPRQILRSDPVNDLSGFRPAGSVNCPASESRTLLRLLRFGFPRSVDFRCSVRCHLPDLSGQGRL